MFWEPWSIASYFQHHFSLHRNFFGAVHKTFHCS
jgi:hypothetical protein